jgi:hypothetical protein
MDKKGRERDLFHFVGVKGKGKKVTRSYAMMIPKSGL